MISRKEHLKQINRFHDEVERVSNEILLDKNNFELLRRYFDLTSKVWPLIDDCADRVKHELDLLEGNFK